MDEFEWIDVVGFGSHQVSSVGRVRSKVLSAVLRARTIGMKAEAEEIGIKQPALSLIKAGKSRAHLHPALVEMGVI